VKTSEVFYELDDGGVIAFGDPEIDLREDPTSLVLRGEKVGSATIHVRAGAFEAELTAQVAP
jgi:hypothetical protein